MNERTDRNDEEAEVDEDGFGVVDERAEFRPTVEMEVQATVDANHPDARVDDGTLETVEHDGTTCHRLAE